MNFSSRMMFLLFLYFSSLDMSAVLNTERLAVGKKVDISDAYSAPANFLEIEGTFIHK